MTASARAPTTREQYEVIRNEVPRTLDRSWVGEKRMIDWPVPSRAMLDTRVDVEMSVVAIPTSLCEYSLAATIQNSMPAAEEMSLERVRYMEL